MAQADGLRHDGHFDVSSDTTASWPEGKYYPMQYPIRGSKRMTTWAMFTSSPYIERLRMEFECPTSQIENLIRRQ